METRGLVRFERWCLATTIAAYCLVGIGGMVRASGAGLGCPDWPKCFGNWMPPTTAAELPTQYDPAQFNVAKTWTEYANRLFGVTVGILIFVSLVLALRHARRHRTISWTMLAAFGVVLFEGWLGGLVVKHGLHPSTLTAHLVGAFVLVALLQFSYLEARRLRTPPRASTSLAPGAPPPPLRKMAVFGMGLLLIQVGVGTQVRAALQFLEQSGASDRSAWLPLGYWPDIFHRQLALVVVAVLVAVAVLARRGHDRAARLWSSVAAAIAMGQLASGLAMAYWAVPPAMQLVHLWGAALAFGALGVVVHRTRTTVRLAS